MEKNTFNDFDTTASNNTDIAGIDIQGTAAVMNFDNALRTLMAILRTDLDNGTVFATKSGAYTALATDNNAVHRFTAAATATLTAAATLGSDWHYTILADGGDVTIDPNAAETINGAATYTLRDGDTCTVICDGTAFYVLHKARLPTVQIFTSSGTWTRPAGCVGIFVEVQGGGGGGGYSKPNALQAAVGGGGGGGGFAKFFVGEPASSYSVTVGAAGVGGIAGSSTASTAGGSSSFGSLCTVTGGAGGTASGSTTTNGGSAAGGAGGVVSVLTPGNGVAVGGARGGYGIVFSASICFGGDGGGSFLSPRTSGTVKPSAGDNAVGYGGGGAGGANVDLANADGGQGKAGLVLVTEFYS